MGLVVEDVAVVLAFRWGSCDLYLRLWMFAGAVEVWILMVLGRCRCVLRGATFTDTSPSPPPPALAGIRGVGEKETSQ